MSSGRVFGGDGGSVYPQPLVGGTKAPQVSSPVQIIDNRNSAEKERVGGKISGRARVG